MSLVIDLSDTLEQQLRQEARKTGISSEAYVIKLIEATVSHSPKETIQALFSQWDEEDLALTLEQQEANQRIYSEIEKNAIPRVRI